MSYPFQFPEFDVFVVRFNFSGSNKMKLKCSPNMAIGKPKEAGGKVLHGFKAQWGIPKPQYNISFNIVLSIYLSIYLSIFPQVSKVPRWHVKCTVFGSKVAGISDCCCVFSIMIESYNSFHSNCFYVVGNPLQQSKEIIGAWPKDFLNECASLAQIHLHTV